MMDEENGSNEAKETLCVTCNKLKQKTNLNVPTQACKGETSSDNYQQEKTNKNSIIGNKLQNLKQKLDSSKNGYTPCCPSGSMDGMEKKGLLQRMHSFSLLKAREKIQQIFPEKIDICQCDENSDTWYHTWPERSRDKSKSPKKVPSDIEAENNPSIHVDVLLNKLPLAYDPVTKQLRLLQPESENSGEITKKETNHKRQPSLLSTISSTGSEVHLPLMTLHSNPQSYSSLSSLSNYSSSTDHTNSLERSCDPPRFGLASFWQKHFTRKSDDNSPASWKFFSRTSFFQKSNSGHSSCSSVNSNNSPTSTPKNIGSTGLILESRPSYLPAKSPEEVLHHQLLHKKLLEESHRREKCKIQEIEKRNVEMCKLEDQIAQASRVWSIEILPQWDTAKKGRKTRDLWWQGLPPCVRGQIWKLSIGNELNVTNDLFAICLERAKEKLGNVNGIGLEGSMDVIKLDLSRTFPHLGIFQQGGPLYGSLDDLLSAYVCFRPDIGYVQGMSFVAATLLLNMDVCDAFVCFANLLNRPLLHAFYRLDQPKMSELYLVYEALFKSHLPKLHSHMSCLNLSSDLYLQEWIYTLFSRSLPLDLASRVWDVYCRDGDDFVFRAAVGILKLYEPALLEMDFIHAAQFLTNLPEDIDGMKLFKAIEQVQSTSEKSRLSQLLTHLSKVKGHS